MRCYLNWCAVVAALLLVGCGHTAHQGRTESRLYPFDSVVYFSARESAVLHMAEEREVKRCMRERGFTYQLAANGGENWEPDNPYGLLTEDIARIDGYHITSSLMVRPDRHSSSTDPTPGPPDDAWQRALVGTSKGEQTINLPGGEQVVITADGCAAEARRQTYGADWDRLYYLFQVLSNQVITQTGKHPSVIAAQQEWARCMAEAGHAAATAEKIRGDVAQRVAAAGHDRSAIQRVAQDELRTAEEDAGCQQRVGLRHAFETAQKEVEQRVLGGRTGDLAELRSLRQRALARASATTTA